MFYGRTGNLSQSRPLDFRLNHCDNPRLRDVIIAVTDRFNWKARRKQAIGLAAGFEKGSYVAACVEVITDPKTGFTIKEFHMAYECGAILNPTNLRAQVEGSIFKG